MLCACRVVATPLQCSVLAVLSSSHTPCYRFLYTEGDGGRVSDHGMGRRRLPDQSVLIMEYNGANWTEPSDLDLLHSACNREVVNYIELPECVKSEKLGIVLRWKKFRSVCCHESSGHTDRPRSIVHGCHQINKRSLRTPTTPSVGGRDIIHRISGMAQCLWTPDPHTCTRANNMELPPPLLPLL